MKEFSTGASSATKTKSFYRSVESLDNDMRKVAAEMGSEVIVIYAMSAKVGKGKNGKKQRETLYVGQSTQVSQRVAQHKMYLHQGAKTPAQKGFTKKSIRNARSYRYYILKICGSQEEANKFEHHYIKALKPLLNDCDNDLGSITRAKINAAKAMFADKKSAIEVSKATGLSNRVALAVNSGVVDTNGEFGKKLDGTVNHVGAMLKALNEVAVKHAYGHRNGVHTRLSDVESAEICTIAEEYHYSPHTAMSYYSYLRTNWKLLFSFDDAFEDEE